MLSGAADSTKHFPILHRFLSSFLLSFGLPTCARKLFHLLNTSKNKARIQLTDSHHQDCLRIDIDFSLDILKF